MICILIGRYVKEVNIIFVKKEMREIFIKLRNPPTENDFPRASFL